MAVRLTARRQCSIILQHLRVAWQYSNPIETILMKRRCILMSISVPIFTGSSPHHTYIHTLAHTFTHTHAHTHIHSYTHTHAHTFIHTHTQRTKTHLFTTWLSWSFSFLALSSASAFCWSPNSSKVIVGADREGRNTLEILSSRL
jgi:hypothetical protein